MKYFVIGDSDTVLGFSYATVDGRVAATREEILAALGEARGKPEVGVVIVTEEIASKVKNELDHIRLTQPRPLIVEIPGPEGPSPDRRTIISIITEAVGIRV